MKRTIKIEPLTSDLWEQVYHPMPFPMKGFAAVEDGKTLAIACIVYANGYQLLAFDTFVDIDMALKRAIIRGWPKFKTLLGDRTMILQDTDKPTSGSFIRHFGGEKWLH